jgi:glycolate oxidase iron-sulfur subunit
MAKHLDRSLLQDLQVIGEDEYRTCSRCGLCLSVCPTYQETWRETDSPRARLMLLRKTIEGELELTPRLIDVMYRCLDCLACNAICPVGMKPGNLALEARYAINQVEQPPWLQSFLLRSYLPHAPLMEASMFPQQVYTRLGLQSAVHATKATRILPEQLRDLERFLPRLAWRSARSRLPEVTPAKGERKYRVAYFVGCVQNVLFSEACAATVRVLAHNGCEVIVPKDVNCCGMPHLGYGEVETARSLARHNIDVLEKLDVDAVLTDCATCGSTLKEYGSHLLKSDGDYAGRASNLAAKTKDISKFLCAIPLREPRYPLRARVTYHDPCHLRRGQGVWREPRKLIELTGAELVELREADWCCGSAGTQILTHHDASVKILARKMENVAATDANIIASGCPGCHLQLRLGVQRAGLEMTVQHPIQLLDRAYQ